MNIMFLGRLARVFTWPIAPLLVCLVVQRMAFGIVTLASLLAVAGWLAVRFGLRGLWVRRPGRAILFDVFVTSACWLAALSPWWKVEVQRHWSQWRLYSRPMNVESLVPQLVTTSVTRAYDASYLSIRPDGAGRLFVGGRDRLFVIEPDVHGGFRSPQELFRFPPDSWLNDVAVRGDDLYVMTNAALYLMPGGRTKRANLECRRLVWGIPLDLHVSFHALAWGPEGDLYFSAGDPYLADGPQRNVPDHWGVWTLFGPDDKPALTHVGTGGVFRCRPDGTRLRRVADGLRGPFGLSFDPSWNLFVCDNDHESRPDRFTPARVLEVVPQVDYGWPRGWTPSNTVRRSDIWPTATAPLGAGVPIGMTYHEGFDDARPVDSFLLSRWESGVDRLIRAGEASGEMSVSQWLLARDLARPLGLSTEADGGVYVVLCKMLGNAKSPHFPAEIRRYAASSRTPALWRDIAALSVDELYGELSAPRLVRRGAAHQELLRRGPEALQLAMRYWRAAKPHDPARRHLPWLVAAGEGPDTTDVLRLCYRDGDEGALQGLRIAAEYPALPFDSQYLQDAVRSGDERVQLFGMLAASARGLWKTADYFAVVRQTETLRTLQLAARLSAERADAAELASAAADPSPRIRLAVVLAIGRKLTTPSVEDACRLAKPYVRGNCTHTIDYVGESLDLTTLGPLGTFSTADLWSGSRNDAKKRRLYDALVACLADKDDAVRFQAAHYLELLQDAPTLPAVRKVWLEADAASLADRPIEPITKVRVRPVGSTADDEIAVQSSDGKLPATVKRDPAGKYQVRFRYVSPIGQSALISIEPSHRAEAVVNDEAASSYQSQLLAYLEPGTNDVTLTLHDVADPTVVQLSLCSREPVVAGDPPLVDQAQSAAAGDRSVDPALVEWFAATSDEELDRLVAAASMEEGRRLFGRDGIGCVRCHEVVAGGRGRGGPTLQNAAGRLKIRHLVDSIVTPSKEVGSQFRRTSLVLDDGRIVRGLVLVDDGDVELLAEDGRRLRIEQSSIEERTSDALSPMPTGLAPTRQAVLDLVAYLVGKQPAPP